MKNIPDKLYKQISEVMPIFCVDGLLLNKENNIVLFKRANNPDKNEWALFGGRLLKGESFEIGIKRKAYEELGILDLIVKKQIGIYNVPNVINRYEFVCHSISLAFLVKTNNKINFNKNEFVEMKEFKTMNGILKNYIQQTIEDSGVFKKYKET